MASEATSVIEAVGVDDAVGALPARRFTVLGPNRRDYDCCSSHATHFLGLEVVRR